MHYDNWQYSCNLARHLCLKVAVLVVQYRLTYRKNFMYEALFENI